jgi:hypothetical protein
VEHEERSCTAAACWSVADEADGGGRCRDGEFDGARSLAAQPADGGERSKTMSTRSRTKTGRPPVCASRESGGAVGETDEVGARVAGLARGVVFKGGRSSLSSVPSIR